MSERLTETIVFRVTPSIKERLEQLAKTRRRRLSDMARILVEDGVNGNVPTALHESRTQYITDPNAGPGICPNCGGGIVRNGRCDVCGTQVTE